VSAGLAKESAWSAALALGSAVCETLLGFQREYVNVRKIRGRFKARSRGRLLKEATAEYAAIAEWF